MDFTGSLLLMGGSFEIDSYRNKIEKTIAGSLQDSKSYNCNDDKCFCDCGDCMDHCHGDCTYACTFCNCGNIGSEQVVKKGDD